MPTISPAELTSEITAILDRVEHDAEEYIIIRNGREVARLVPEPSPSAAYFSTMRRDKAPLDKGYLWDTQAPVRLLVEVSPVPWQS